MVLLDSTTLPNALTTQRETETMTAVKAAKDEAYETVIKSAEEGEIITVSGRIRYTTVPTETSSIWSLFKTGGSHTLDLQDGSSTKTVMISRLQFRRSVYYPHRIFYTVDLEYVDNP